MQKVIVISRIDGTDMLSEEANRQLAELGEGWKVVDHSMRTEVFDVRLGDWKVLYTLTLVVEK